MKRQRHFRLHVLQEVDLPARVDGRFQRQIARFRDFHHVLVVVADEDLLSRHRGPLLGQFHHRSGVHQSEAEHVGDVTNYFFVCVGGRRLLNWEDG